jgi:plastocyanin
VDIKNFAFSPANLTVKKGTTVKWTNYDDMAHTVVENDNKTGPGSSLLAKNQTYSFTYNEVGTFAYKCSVHPNMTGTVTVTE